MLQMVYLGTPWVVSGVPIQQVAKSLPPASPQDSFSVLAGVGQPSGQRRASGVPGVMAGPSETKPLLFAAMFDRSSLNRARLCDHENLSCHLRFGADRHRRRNLYGPRADERNGTSCRP